MAKRIVVATFGSLGDLHPFLALARGLQARGHQVVVATSEAHRPRVEALGIDFHAVRPDLRPDPALVRRALDPLRGLEYVLRELIFPHLRATFEDSLRAVDGADLLVTHAIAYAGPVVAELTGVRWTSTVLAPIAFLSAYDPPVLSPLPAVARLRSLGPLVNRAVVRLGRLKARRWSEPVRRLRRELGLPRGGDPLFEGQHSPRLVLALFSRLLADIQPDWPQQTRITGFLFHDEDIPTSDVGGARDGALPSRLDDFLAAGDPPIVFTLGSVAVLAPGSFYADSVAAARRLGVRAVLLVGRGGPPPPAGAPADRVAVLEYAPYSTLFPRAAAIVHHGGIGTTAQALRAGRPMLVVPHSHDQPDNAARVARIGAGRVLPRAHYDEERAFRALRNLLRRQAYAERAKETGEIVRLEDGVRAACGAIEQEWEKA